MQLVSVQRYFDWVRDSQRIANLVTWETGDWVWEVEESKLRGIEYRIDGSKWEIAGGDWAIGVYMRVPFL